MKGNHIIRKGTLLLLAMVFTILPFGNYSYSQKPSSSQRRAEKAKAKKEKEATKKYEQAIKQHQKNQSANTRAMMKQTKKDSPKNTPLRKAKGKKCK